MRTKEPTVVLVYRGWVDDNVGPRGWDAKTRIVDLTAPDSFEELEAAINDT